MKKTLMIFIRTTSQFSFLLIILLAALSIVLFNAPSLAFSLDDLNSMSSQTTVLIAKSLSKGDLENKQEWFPGSGSIVAHIGNTYYAVTNTHVVRQQNKGELWGVRTADGEVHKIIDDENSIFRFGKFTGDTDPMPGFDLALVKFTSNINYPVAVLGDSSKLQPGNEVFISGWPNPENLDARRQRQFTGGKIAKISTSPDLNGGYSLMYSNWTRPGMSGSPVFNIRGEIIGIHGKGRGTANDYCVDKKLSPNNSCGIQQIHLIKLPKVNQMNLAFTPPPVNPAVIMQGRKNKDKADKIEDIYKLFTLGAMRRDAGIGSGGCGSLLLGDRCR
jgi:serine protease Do